MGGMCIIMHPPPFGSETRDFDIVSGSIPRPDQAEIKRLLVLVGKNVRVARASKCVSRRVLSDLSGVSPRYLAQLESGKANVSVALLFNIAGALEISPDRLISSDPHMRPDLETLGFLYSNASHHQRQNALAALRPATPQNARAGRIALVGLRGAGKSTLGGRVAADNGIEFLELDSEIESASGVPVHEVFSLYGDTGYRRLERQALDRVVATRKTLILAVAGGIVSEPASFTLLLRHFFVIWIRAGASEHMERVRSQGDERPMIGNPDALAELRGILTNRETQYAQAHATVDTSGQTEETSRQNLNAVIMRGTSGG